MRVVIHTHQLEMGPDLTAQLGRDVSALLGRFEGWIRLVTVRIHGDAGEVTLATCCVLVDLDAGGGLGVEEAAPTPEAALVRATLRTRTVLADHLRRRQGLPPDTRYGYAMVLPNGA